MIRSAARFANFTEEIKGLQTLPVALVLKYWLCEAHGKTYLLRLTLIRLRPGGIVGVESVRASILIVVRAYKTPNEVSLAIPSFKGEDVP